MKLSLCIAPGPQSREIAVQAERIGYERIWFYDSAALYEDIWIHLALVAEVTSRIGLGTAVLVPSNRHVMTTASAIATIERLAPGRLACAFGTGYTGRAVLGQRPLGWEAMRTYLEQLQGLLHGDVVEIDGQPCQMIHHPALAVPRPIRIPMLVSAFGPRGLSVSRELGDGWMGVTPPPEPVAWAVQMVHGSVLAPGESPASPRVVDAVGPWLAGMFHMGWETDPASLAALPGGPEWLACINSERPEGERHLSVHFGHITHLSEADRRGIAAMGEHLPWFGWVAEEEGLRTLAAKSAAAGTTELMYTPSGSDVVGEAERFYRALKG